MEADGEQERRATMKGRFSYFAIQYFANLQTSAKVCFLLSRQLRLLLLLLLVLPHRPHQVVGRKFALSSSALATGVTARHRQPNDDPQPDDPPRSSGATFSPIQLGWLRRYIIRLRAAPAWFGCCIRSERIRSNTTTTTIAKHNFTYHELQPNVCRRRPLLLVSSSTWSP